MDFFSYVTKRILKLCEDLHKKRVILLGKRSNFDQDENSQFSHLLDKIIRNQSKNNQIESPIFTLHSNFQFYWTPLKCYFLVLESRFSIMYIHYSPIRWKNPGRKMSEYIQLKGQAINKN